MNVFVKVLAYTADIGGRDVHLHVPAMWYNCPHMSDKTRSSTSPDEHIGTQVTLDDNNGK